MPDPLVIPGTDKDGNDVEVTITKTGDGKVSITTKKWKKPKKKAAGVAPDETSTSEIYDVKAKKDGGGCGGKSDSGVWTVNVTITVNCPDPKTGLPKPSIHIEVRHWGSKVDGHPDQDIPITEEEQTKIKDWIKNCKFDELASAGSLIEKQAATQLALALEHLASSIRTGSKSWAESAAGPVYYESGVIARLGQEGIGQGLVLRVELSEDAVHGRRFVERRE